MMAYRRLTERAAAFQEVTDETPSLAERTRAAPDSVRLWEREAYAPFQKPRRGARASPDPESDPAPKELRAARGRRRTCLDGNDDGMYPGGVDARVRRLPNLDARVEDPGVMRSDVRAGRRRRNLGTVADADRIFQRDGVDDRITGRPGCQAVPHEELDDPSRHCRRDIRTGRVPADDPELIDTAAERR